MWCAGGRCRDGRFSGSWGWGAWLLALGACGDDGGGADETPAVIPNGDFMFDSDGVQIHYTITGSGPPLVLLHGWANRYEEMWVGNGWVDELSPIRTIIGVDQRGHGTSDKPHDPAAYSTARDGG